MFLILSLQKADLFHLLGRDGVFDPVFLKEILRVSDLTASHLPGAFQAVLAEVVIIFPLVKVLGHENFVLVLVDACNALGDSHLLKAI